ncbi:MAG: DUF3311 domain-containing protein [Planctomycetota bacterium]|nr:DUF3311 domain-containing protein [Planctomycetota bacterium]
MRTIGYGLTWVVSSLTKLYGVFCMRKFCIWSLVVILLVLHQDNWFWTDGKLVFGFMPIGLLYHAVISFAAACLWFAAILLIWPEGVDREASSDDAARAENQGAAEA